MLWLFGQCITLHWHWMVNKMMAASNASNVSNVSNVSNASKVSTVSNVSTVSCQQAQTTYPGWVSIKLLPMDIVSNCSFTLQCRCQLLGWTTMTRCTRQKLPETWHRLSLGQPTPCFRPSAPHAHLIIINAHLVRKNVHLKKDMPVWKTASPMHYAAIHWNKREKKL